MNFWNILIAIVVIIIYLAVAFGLAIVFTYILGGTIDEHLNNSKDDKNDKD